MKRRNAQYVLLSGLGAAALFHLAAMGVWPERLEDGIGEHSGKMAVDKSKLTPRQWNWWRSKEHLFLATITILTASPGSLLTFNVPGNWNNGNNSVETIAGGASGGATDITTGRASGGGGGAYSRITNLTLTPGGTASYEIGVGGAAASTGSGSVNGNPGGDSWFNGATLGASSVGSKAGLAGSAASTGSPAGGLGGAAASGVGATKTNGGRGGNTSNNNENATGGGGAGGPTGDGNQGVDSTAASQATNGGSGDAGTGGTAGVGSIGSAATGGAGGAGTELGGGGAGAGGGGGACVVNSGGNSPTGGSGGNYGGGGAGAIAASISASVTSGAGIQGVIIVTNTPTPINPPFTVISNLVGPAWVPPPPYAGPYRWVLTPPSNPPQNPPFPGPSGFLPAAVEVSWLPLPPDPLLGPDLLPLQPRKTIPVSGPQPQNPPFPGPLIGVPTAILDAWLPPDPYVGPMRILKTPPSGPPSGNAGALFTLFNSIVSGGNLGWAVFDLYTISLFNGQVLRFTTADFDINVAGTLFSSQGVRIDQGQSKAQAHWKIGFDVDTWMVVLMPRPIDIATGAVFPDVIGSMPWIQAAHSGSLDAADFQVDRAYFSSMPTWPITPGGAVPTATRTVFAGKIGAVDCTDLVVIITANDYRDLLSINMPLHFFSAQCRFTLFDPGCNADGTMTAGRFQQAGTVKAGSTQAAIIPLGGMPNPGGSGTYQLGTITMTSGNNNTFTRTIVTWDGTTMKLVSPFPFPVNPGDTFVAVAGCDLQRSTCTQFGNLVNFGGQPYIPAPEVTS